MSKEIFFKCVGGEMRFYRSSFFKSAYPQVSRDSVAESNIDLVRGKHKKMCLICNQEISENSNNPIERKAYTHDTEKKEFTAKLKPKISSYKKLTQDKIMSLFQ